MPDSLRILEFCKMNATGGPKWEDTRGATQGQTGVREGEGGGTGPRGSSEFVPNFSGIKRQAGPGWDLGSGKMGLMVQGGRALLGARVLSSPSGFRSDRARGREGRSGELRPLPRGQTRETEGRKVPTPPWEFGAGGYEDSFCQRKVPVAVGLCQGSLEKRGRSCLPPRRRRRQRRRRGWISSITPTQPPSAVLPRAEGSRLPVTRPSPPRPGPGWARPTT